MENNLLTPSKQTKPDLSTELLPAKLILIQKIPKNTFLRLTQCDAVRKACRKILSSHRPKLLEAEIFWRYARVLKKIHKWKFFKELDIQRYRYKEETDYIFSYHQASLGINIKNIRAFPFIKKLEIKFHSDKLLTNERLKSDFIEICRTLTLEELDFQIVGCEQITVQTLKDILRHIVKYQHNLKNLSFQTQTYPHIDDEGLEFFGNQIGRHLRNLRFLDLCFNERKHRFQIKPAPISQEFKNLGSNTPVSDQGLKVLGHNLSKNLINLRHLAIHMYWVKEINDKGVKALVSEIGKKLKDLRSLEIVFRECQGLTGSGMKSVVNDICKNFKDLKNLSLGFYLCDRVFPNDVKAVIKKVKKELPELEQLSLNEINIATEKTE